MLHVSARLQFSLWYELHDLVIYFLLSDQVLAVARETWRLACAAQKVSSCVHWNHEELIKLVNATTARQAKSRSMENIVKLKEWFGGHQHNLSCFVWLTDFVPKTSLMQSTIADVSVMKVLSILLHKRQSFISWNCEHSRLIIYVLKTILTFDCCEHKKPRYFQALKCRLMIGQNTLLELCKKSSNIHMFIVMFISCCPHNCSWTKIKVMKSQEEKKMLLSESLILTIFVSNTKFLLRDNS